MFLKLLVISIIFLILTALGFGIRILIKGKFPATHVSENEEMTKRGITCAEHTDIGCQTSESHPGCASCSSRVF